MNISSGIFSTHESNSSGHIFSGTEVETNFEIASVIYIFSILLSLPTNSYVIWLIVTGTGNGLAAEMFSLNLFVCETLVSLETLLILLSYKFEIFSIGLGFLDGLLCTGRPLFQCLICVERYVAVIYPVTFLKFKPLRYRLLCSVIGWVAIFVSAGFSVALMMFIYKFYIYYLITMFFLLFSVQLFCCLAVLRALKQSAPGERGREREEENHMKRRAFYLILITTVTMVVIHASYTVLAFVSTSESLYAVGMCVIQFWFVVAGLVQPLLFLCRVEKQKLIRCLSFFSYLYSAAICK